jgi:hypothetical protein
VKEAQRAPHPRADVCRNGDLLDVNGLREGELEQAAEVGCRAVAVSGANRPRNVGVEALQARRVRAADPVHVLPVLREGGATGGSRPGGAEPDGDGREHACKHIALAAERPRMR